MRQVSAGARAAAGAVGRRVTTRRQSRRAAARSNVRGARREADPTRSQVTTAPPGAEGSMDPGTVGVFIPIAAILAWGAVRIASIHAESRKAADPDTANRLQA